MSERRAGRVLQRIAAYLLAAGGLVWVFHDVNWPALAKSLLRFNARWVALALLLDILSYAAQGYRWHLLLKPLGRIDPLRTTQAVYAGLFVSEVLPMRVGEIVRAYLVSLWMAKDIVAVVPSMALERLSEGIWLAAGLGVTAIFVPLPHDFLVAGDIFGLVVIVLTGVFLYLIFRKKREAPGGGPEQPVRTNLLRRLLAVPGRLEGGFRSIGLTPSSIAAFFTTLLHLALQAVSFWCVMKAYGLPFSLWVGTAVSLIVRFGIALPNAPASVGTYQLFCVLGLTAFGLEKTEAAAFSIVVFILLSLPLWVIGFFALSQSGLTIPAVRERLKTMRARA